MFSRPSSAVRLELRPTDILLILRDHKIDHSHFRKENIKMQLFTRSAFNRLVALATLMAWPSSLAHANNNDLASFRALTVEEQQSAVDLILNQTQASGFLALGRDLEGEPTVQQLRNLISEPLRHYQLSFGINRMLQDLFQDAHTRVEVNEELTTAQYKVLDLCLAWLYGDELQLVNTCETDYANPGEYRQVMAFRHKTQMSNSLWLYFTFKQAIW